MIPNRTAPARPIRTALAAVTALLAAALPAAPAADDHLALVPLHTVVVKEGVPFPRFEVDAGWPEMPSDLILGQVSGVSVDANDDVWVVHRPHSLHGTQTGVTAEPPIADCCTPAPVVVRFSKGGTFEDAWGDESSAPLVDGVRQFPASVHGVHVTDDDVVWIGGNGDGDHAVYAFTRTGEFLRTIGRREDHRGNTDTGTLGRPADIHADGDQVIVADGYTNRRVIRFTGEDDAFGGYWGAFGNEIEPITDDAAPLYDPESPEWGDIVHCVVSDGEGGLYVCDRRNLRVQLFRQTGDGDLEFVRNIPIAPENSGATGTATDVALSPDGRFLYVADMVNAHVWILDRKTHEPIAHIGRIGRQAGQFIWPHSIDVDSDGNLYVTEVFTGQRVQKLVLTGVR
jgi:hypothetical protein